MSAQAGESSRAVRSSPLASALSAVCSAVENALFIAERDVVIEVMALGRSASPETSSAALSIFAASLSTVFDSSSIEVLTSSPDSVSGAPSALRSSTSVSVELLTSFAASLSASDVSDDGLLNWSLMPVSESVQVVMEVQRPSAHSSVGEADDDSSPQGAVAATDMSPARRSSPA